MANKKTIIVQVIFNSKMVYDAICVIAISSIERIKKFMIANMFCLPVQNSSFYLDRGQCLHRQPAVSRLGVTPGFLQGHPKQWQLTWRHVVYTEYGEQPAPTTKQFCHQWPTACQQAATTLVSNIWCVLMQIPPPQAPHKHDIRCWSPKNKWIQRNLFCLYLELTPKTRNTIFERYLIIS